MREELSTVISNRSAAYYESHDYISALADAETVIQIRRNWSKGHFRKSKALLGLGKFKEAAEAVKVGLSFEPTNAVRHVPLYTLCVCHPPTQPLFLAQELLSFLAEIQRFDAKVEQMQEKASQPVTASA